MKKFLKFIYTFLIKGSYYSMLFICGIIGINQLVLETEYKDTNILILTISLFAIGYSIKNIIKIIKET